LQIAADMRLARASPAARNPARLSLILNAHWNKSGWRGIQFNRLFFAMHEIFLGAIWCDLVRFSANCAIFLRLGLGTAD
jgi:hypothetical protein